MRSRLRWVNAVLALCVVVAVAGAYVAVGSTQGAEQVSTRTARVSQGTVTATVSGTGNTASADVVSITPSTSGTLTSVKVRVGSKVTKGQVLARLDPTDTENALATARSQRDTAQAQYDEVAAGESAADATKDQLSIDAAQLGLDNARSQLAAAKDARPRNATAANQAAQQVASAKIQVAHAKATAQGNAAKPTAAELAQVSASLDTAVAAVEDAKDTVAATTIKAPRAGTVLSVSAAVGETLSGSSSGSTGSGSAGSSGSGSSDSSGSGTTSDSSSSSSGSSSAFITIADLDDLVVTANVAEADAADVKVGQNARITLSASGTATTGKVTAVALEGITSSNVVQYPVTVALDEAPDGVKLGASASVVITTGSKASVLSVPTSAITTVGPSSSVTVVTAGVQKTVPVTTGLEGNSSTEISGDGLAAGDQVLLTATGTSTSTGVPGGDRARVGGLTGVGGGARP